MLEHTGIASLREFFRNEFEINTTDRIVQFASISFDASVWEIFMALLTGASLHLVSEETIKNPDQFQRFINEHGITVATPPPTYLANLDLKHRTLRTMITAGQSTTPISLRNGRARSFILMRMVQLKQRCTTTTCDETTEQYHSVPIASPYTIPGFISLTKTTGLFLKALRVNYVSGDTLARDT